MFVQSFYLCFCCCLFLLGPFVNLWLLIFFCTIYGLIGLAFHLWTNWPGFPRRFGLLSYFTQLPHCFSLEPLGECITNFIDIYDLRFVNTWFIRRLSHISIFDSRVIKMGHIRTKRFYLLTATGTKLCPQFDHGWLPFKMKRNEKCAKPLQIKWWAIILSAKATWNWSDQGW